MFTRSVRKGKNAMRDIPHNVVDGRKWERSRLRYESVSGMDIERKAWTGPLRDMICCERIPRLSLGTYFG